MFIKNGDDPKTKIIVIVDPSGVEEELDVNTKAVLEKVKENIVKTTEQKQISKEKS